MSITNKQLALIHIAKSQLGLADLEYRDLLQKICGVSSSKELNQNSFSEIMYAFKLLGFKPKYKNARFGEREGMASPAQIDFIESLWREYIGGTKKEGSLGRWLENSFGVSHVRFLDSSAAGKVITGLKQMTRRKSEKVCKSSAG